MIEVLLALGLLSCVLLSLLAYQLTLIKAAEALNFQVIATQQLSNFSEKIEFAQSAESREDYFNQWEKENKAYLPNANSYFQSDHHICTLQLKWTFSKRESQENVVYCR